MKPFISKHVICICILLVFGGCSVFTAHGRLEKEGRLAYQNGDYDLAVYRASQALALKPNYQPAQLLISNAFKAAVLYHDDTIKRLNISDEKYRWDDLVKEYQALVQINQIIERLPTLRSESGDLIEIATVDYTVKLDSANRNAAEFHYTEGMRLSTSDDLKLKKMSAKEFRAAAKYVPGFRDSDARYEEMREAAILRMAIFIEDKSRQRQFGSISETIMDNVVNSIFNDKEATEFLELISRDQLENVLSEQAMSQTGIVDETMAIEAGRLMSVHQIIAGKITQITYTPPELSVRKRKETKKVVIGKEKYVNKNGEEKVRKIYEDVEAIVSFFSRSTAVRINGSYTIVDVATSKIVKSDTFEEFVSATKEWATFKGDERSLSFSTKTFVRRGVQQVPVAGEMVNRAAKKLSSSLSSSIKDYAR